MAVMRINYPTKISYIPLSMGHFHQLLTFQVFSPINRKIDASEFIEAPDNPGNLFQKKSISIDTQSKCPISKWSKSYRQQY